MSTDRVESDIDEKTLLVTPPKSHAAGVEAVLVSLRRGIEQMGLARTARTLVKLNQRNGFDCPGCAWPETPGHRKHAEFCQNGAKAVAEEATRRVVDPDFFDAHPASELRERTDYWLGQQGRITEPMVLLPGATHYTPISWRLTYSIIAHELRALDTPSGPCAMGGPRCSWRWAATSSRPRDERRFDTTSGKATFVVNDLRWVPVPAGRLILQTMRSHDQYNTTIYGLDDRYRGIKNGRRVLQINATDIGALGYTDGDIVDLVSEWPRADGTTHQRRAPNLRLVAYPTPVGNVAAYYPETNPLIPFGHVADKSNAPVSKAVTIRLEPARS